MGNCRSGRPKFGKLCWGLVLNIDLLCSHTIGQYILLGHPCIYLLIKIKVLSNNVHSLDAAPFVFMMFMSQQGLVLPISVYIRIAQFLPCSFLRANFSSHIKFVI
jgi:hypothetical protein